MLLGFLLCSRSLPLFVFASDLLLAQFLFHFQSFVLSCQICRIFVEWRIICNTIICLIIRAHACVLWIVFDVRISHLIVFTCYVISFSYVVLRDIIVVAVLEECPFCVGQRCSVQVVCDFDVLRRRAS